MDDKDKFMVETLIDYQQCLVNRRWQAYFAYLIANALFFNALKAGEILCELPIPILISSLGVIIGLMMLRHASLNAIRLVKAQKRLIEDFNVQILDVPLESKFTFQSETTTIYICIIAFIFAWMYLIYCLNISIFLILFLLSVIILSKLRWCPLKHK